MSARPQRDTTFAEPSRFDRFGSSDTIDPAGLVAFRVMYGLLAAFSAIRFVANGWVERFFGEPTFFFRFWGFEWVPVPSVAGVYALFAVMAVAGVCVALGYRYRLALVVHLVCFAWVELIDVTNYLNHYHLFLLLGVIALFLPLHRSTSLDVRHGRVTALSRFPRRWARALQLQVGLVYVFAGLAKANTDWLVHAQPLNIWLSSRQDFPVLGPLFGHFEVALFFSWAGFLHDLLVPFLLLWRKTVWFAFAALCVFHFTTHLLFDIGLFPLIMTMAATTFLPPDWPRRVGRFFRRPASDISTTETLDPRAIRPKQWIYRVAAVFFAVQLLMPLRAHLYGGDVNWHEQGMRWSWRVMVREKNGSVLYRVKLAGRDGELHVTPSRYLTSHQEREMSGQPDLILQLAHHIADDFRLRGHQDVEVRVDALVSHNGRPMAALIDPTVDLAKVSDGLAKADWILDRADVPPVRLRPARLESARADAPKND
ncbi:MAG TPA: HTTM domain-containing protein [Myxococcota bacterium]|nr:HTTM domain-containing protein [Myxococcota bacterium]